MNDKILAVDIGGTSVKAGLFDMSASEPHLLEKERIPLPEPTIDAVKKIVQNLIAKYNPEKVGISTVGSVQPDGMVRSMPRISGYNDFYWSEHLPPKVAVEILNDGQASALGVYKFDKTVKARSSLIHVVVGSGIGSGIIIGGQVWRGAGGVAGHVAFMITNNQKPGHYLEDIFTSIIYQNGALRKDDASVTEAGRNLGYGLASLTHIFNPEIITLGGGVFDAFGGNSDDNPLFKATLKSFQAAGRPNLIKDTTLQVTSLGNDAALYGAASLHINN